jgi:pimeloyl-ACP methyl ester carboxylesterase
MTRSARISRLVTAAALLFPAAHVPAASLDLPRASFLGVQAAPVDDETRARLRLGATAGVLVAGVVPGGSAEAAGLREDDLLVAIDNQPIADPGQLVARIAPHRAGDRINIRWIRAGETRDAEVVMKPRPLESAPGTRTEYGALAVNDSLRRTIVTGPVDEARHPAVLYMTGIGCFSQESLGAESTESQLLHGLARAGFLTMRVEKSGVGDSQGPACSSPQADLKAETAAYLAGLRALRSSPRVDPDRVFLLGLSIGGVHAPLIAQQERLRGVVVINTLAKPFIEYLLETRRRQGRLAGLGFDEIDRRQRVGEWCNHALLVEGRRPQDIVSARPECRESIQYAAPYTYMQQWAALDPSSEWKRVAVPVLVVQGETDYVATVADAPLLRDVINSFHPGRATLAMIPAMDHFLTQAASMRKSLEEPSGVFEPKVLQAVQDWLVRQSAG